MHSVSESGPTKAVLFTVIKSNVGEAESSLGELGALVEATGSEIAGTVLQIRVHPDPALFLGRGKVQELKNLMLGLGAEVAVCDDELSPSQQRNLERELGCSVFDRTYIILRIFAARAQSAEGKMQVELAQLAYHLPRLRGKGVEMSSLGASEGGLRTRGPGETKLEYDRRRIKTRMADLRRRIDDLEQHRGLAREQRLARGVPTVALVGYTNAGKSSLLNALTEGGAFVEDKLFATLDPLARELLLPDGRLVMLVDTVGFVRKLPHQLVSAFRATLSEVRNADLLLHVVDSSHPGAAEQARTVCDVLGELGAADKPMVTALNKIDLVHEPVQIDMPGPTVAVSAVVGTNLALLTAAIADGLIDKPIRQCFVVPFSRGDLLDLLYKKGDVIAASYTDQGTEVLVDVLKRYADKVASELNRA